ncbi:hypothetical protein SMACR_05899 [Sordaria macrospora]|uniref:WGS project CABT00000000 data, contig 2.24 n=2 Tax=Sordaria macrospora TaxID=5147 RepID=F7W3F9_SORMK|nr:uncharacterized protein SMAC_05899 [Sordaria macrospora k-hell]KAA8634314.1 hypothetical protein SMACR_05899 [Sordaria macrospora]KAH7627907.1 hypothetical protein B0T09DRAFT_385333 [Sordaria sp. MPI-SDFR-AT-0083]WPJ65365.1 hypothetical protein SMAC4_05899 [Sordaria macrospora]CCC12161.1 unnamed protein product [Sordaria macrospora k-hell]
MDSSSGNPLADREKAFENKYIHDKERQMAKDRANKKTQTESSSKDTTSSSSEQKESSGSDYKDEITKLSATPS